MSRDDKASYYDLELPDGTVVEAQDVTRALLERAALPPYASKCLGTLLERVWRFGAKPGTDTAREAEKVVTEATFLCEALGGVPSFTMRDVARAAHDTGIEIKFSCDDPAARIAELERERDEVRLQVDKARDGVIAVQREYNDLFDTTGKEIKLLKQECAEARTETARWRTTAERAQSDLDALRKTLETEREDHVARGVELERVRKELAALHARYRPRRQSEEPAPKGKAVLRWSDEFSYWVKMDGSNLENGRTWTHQPPAPGEGE